jgi:ATP-dependent Clp protease protease subunit
MNRIMMGAVVPLRPTEAKTPAGYQMKKIAPLRAEIFLYGTIGMDWFGEGITAKQFVKDLKALGDVKNIDLRINSEGGAVVDAEAIHTHLVEHPADITVHVDGIAASAASFIAMAGKEIIIAESGFMMIHEARMGDYGTADEKRRLADLLDRTNEKIVKKYVARTGNSEAKVRDWMKAETWFIGEEAVKAGFADKVVENLKVAASISHPENFKNLPAALRPNRLRAAAALAEMRRI